jgi:hypothetical protein
VPQRSSEEILAVLSGSVCKRQQRMHGESRGNVQHDDSLHRRKHSARVVSQIQYSPLQLGARSDRIHREWGFTNSSPRHKVCH